MSDPVTEEATLGGGCFWCLEAAFDQLEGVVNVESGYAGGSPPFPTYEQVCSGATGHAEVVRVTYRRDRIGYEDLLEVFFTIHDPTTKDRQGADVGTQYRSVIFHHGEEQRRVAERVIRRLEEEEVFDAPIVTEVTPAPEFFPAEAYHQEYYRRNSRQPYCQVVIAPKLARLRQRHAERLRP